MPPINKKLSYVGLMKQAGGAKGSGGASPATFGFGVLGGTVFETPIEQDYDDTTLPGGTSDRMAPHLIRTAINPGMTFRTRAYVRSLGLLLLGALGADVVTGSGPYVHAFEPALTLPYLTAFGKYGTAEYEKLVDVLVDELTIGWDERNPLEVEAKLLGLTPTMGAGGAWTATNDETLVSYIGPQGSTLQIDVDGAVLAAAQVKGASVKISNNLDPVMLSKSVLPDDLVPALQTIEGSITIVPNDFAEWRSILTGTPSGTAIAPAPVYGSFSLLNQIDSNNQLTLAATRVGFLTDFPESEPSGGQMEMELAFQVIRPTDGSDGCTFTLKNSTATY